MGLPVYEDLSRGHATHMYGALAPHVLGAVFRLTGVNLWAGRVLAFVASLTLVAILTAIVLHGAEHRFRLGLVAVTLFLGVDLASGHYFTQNRPDMLALLLGLLGLVGLYRGHRDQNLWLYLAGVGTIIVGVFIKQTAATVALIPVIPVLFGNSPESRIGRVMKAIAPVAGVIASLVALSFLRPEVFFYMVEMPRQYPIRLATLVHATMTLLTGFPLFVVLAVSWLLVSSPRDWRSTAQRTGVWPWAVSAVIVLVPTSALAMAKAGGTTNSLIPAMLAIAVFCVLRLRSLTADSTPANTDWMHRSWASFLLAALLLLGTPNIAASFGYFDSYHDYPLVVQHVRALRGSSVISPEDPTITVLALGVASRNIYMEYDAHSWPLHLPKGLRDEFDRADVVVDVKQWWGDLVNSKRLAGLGFVPANDFPHYTIWRRPSAAPLPSIPETDAP